MDPDLIPYATAARSADGAMTLRPPGSKGRNLTTRESREWNATPLPRPPQPLPTRVIECLEPHSYLARYLRRELYLPRLHPSADQWIRYRKQWIETLSRRPHYAWILPSGSAETWEWAVSWFLPRHLPGDQEYFIGFTAFALDRFKARADRDGSTLVILTTSGAKNQEGGAIMAMARERGIPVIDLPDYIVRQRRDVRESHFAHDVHWTAIGHLWAAEAAARLTKRRRAGKRPRTIR